MQDAISHDPYEDQLSAARFKAERDVAIQELDRMRPAYEWVEEHGGLSHVKDIYNDFRAVVERLGVEWSESELHGLMDVLDRRLMPEGYIWPEFENGDPVRIGDEFADGFGDTRRCTSIEILHGEGGVFDALIHWSSFDPLAYLLVNMWEGERVKRPAVPAADNEPLEVGQTVWDANGDEFRVLDVYGSHVDEDFPEHTVRCRRAGAEDYESTMCAPSQLTLRAPVLAADGRPLREGETVWHVRTGREYVVVEPSYGKTVVVRLAKYDDAEGEQYAPDQLTHERPDSWDRLIDDATQHPWYYCRQHGVETDAVSPDADLAEVVTPFAQDLVRRAKALAEKENRNE